MSSNISRRQFVAGLSASVAAATTIAESPDTSIYRDVNHREPDFGYCLNTSTISGQKLPLRKMIEVAAGAGYQGIEPWTRDINSEVKNGVTTKDLKKRISDAGLTVASAIGFAEWIVDDQTRRKKGLENARRDMELVRAVGGSFIAAPPVGATDQSDLDLDRAAERYRTLLEIGEAIGVTPQLELWGFSKSIHRIGELLYVASESGHHNACLLPDVYHIYKGGSSFEGLRLIAGQAMHTFHMNDYPAEPQRDKIGDADRIYPGDGIAPLEMVIKTLHQNGFRGMLSLELFNRNYWKQDVLTVARTGLEKMQGAVAAALNR